MKIQGERNTMQMDKTIHEKEMQVSELLKNFQNDRNSVNEKNEGNEFRDLENMEGGLVDVKKQIALAATTIKVLYYHFLNLTFEFLSNFILKG